ncbi:LOW QUALITY PROTEIN: protein LSM14 homolog B [Xyrichtys novacula]|uniref:LOW QUALITY PROTEIN: protein LSM14 homolog B n=1 Tax=Xyrichtys novacula TaxID=13765 RepID=A0AAV1HFY8_XYRNO|nr:LOW QUALITY PROTEIN: protein LSM14 homolog B [Xyrichtys novacula]
MSSGKPCIGCKIALISKAQNRYEGILYTIDKVNSTVVLAKVRCLGTEGRPTDRPTPPKDDVYEFITFRGSDIKDITLCESPRSHHGLPPDPAIVQSSIVGSSGVYHPHGPFSPRMQAHNQLAAGPVLSQQYAAALGLGLQVRRGPMVEKAVQTLHVDRSRQRRPLTASQEQEWRWERRRPLRTRQESPQTRGISGATRRSRPGLTSAETLQQNNENRLPPRRRQGARRRRNRSRGQMMVASGPSATLKFDTDFDFDSSNAQFMKEQLQKEAEDRMNSKEGDHEAEEKEKEELHLSADDEHFGPKCYYDKAKSFFDNISSDKKFRLTWAEERKRNLETFGVPGRFLRGQGFRGYSGRRRLETPQYSSYRTRSGQL